MDATIVIPVFNQLAYTRQCLESLNAAACADAMIVVVNNASTDGTMEFLATRRELRVINNAENRACAAAWNQGFHASTTKWIVFLNNDIVVARGWLENLIAFAERDNVAIASPAMAEGELNYDLEDYARGFILKMEHAQRCGTANGACFLVSRRVFETIGGFDENFRKGGNEDDDFFWRAKRAGFKLATSGCAYIHHFGNVTQKAVVAERGSHRVETIGYFRAKWKITWLKRRLLQIRRKTSSAWRTFSERWCYGHTLREIRHEGKIFYK